METLEIESTERTPGIIFDYDHHYFEINGEAYPENSDEFFRPIMESLQEYSGLGSSETITFVFKLIYFNSSSARVLMKLFELLDEMAEERNVEIEWHYHEEDDTMEEFGEEFAEDMENASFQLKSHNDG